MPRITPGVTELRMQLATVGPVTPSAVLNTYGAAVNLTSPRAGGGIVPLMIRAICAAALANITLRILPTWSDGTVGAGVLWTPFTAASTVMQSAIGTTENNGVPVAGPSPATVGHECQDSTLDLSAFFKQGVSLRQLAFDCQSSGNADTAAITITYFGLYT